MDFMDNTQFNILNQTYMITSQFLYYTKILEKNI